MTLHIFNPEHDIALAANLANFTSPKAGRELRRDLGFLPLLWAKDGDSVLVDDIEIAQRGWEDVCRQLTKYGLKCGFSLRNHRFLPRKPSVSALETAVVEPWGWDKALCSMLKRYGFNESLLPADDHLEQIRNLSHRRTAARLLAQLQLPGTVGEAFECSATADMLALKERYGSIVVKAPWSSSGRGVRVLQTSDDVEKAMKWMENVLKTQGNIMVEPYYEKVMDLGMEFTAQGKGGLKYDGLSLFATRSGAYTGNLLATERRKKEIVSHYIPVELLDAVQEKIISHLDLADYEGPLGVDMMVVKSDGSYKNEEGTEFLLHPCVEVNVRRTMGHVALSLTPKDDDHVLMMSIEYDGSHYLFNIKEQQN